MSSSIAIPAGVDATYKRAGKQNEVLDAAGSSSSSFANSPMTPQSTKSSPVSSEKKPMLHARRPSLLSAAISQQKAEVINIGEEEAPRLISYLTSGQGYLWNPEIFLPSYIDVDYTPLENQREPVIDIRLSDEEIANMYPN